MGLTVAVDTGGTFTDLVAYDTNGGAITYTKSLTDYRNLVASVMDAVKKAKTNLGEADLVKFGTTLVINTYIQRNGARTALVTTAGFRDILEMRRGNRPFAFDLHYHRDPALVNRELCLEVNERIGADGETVLPLDTAGLAKLVKVLRKLDIEAVAVSFVNSYVNSRHEAETAAYLRQHLPGVYITTGTELSREWYEYERTATAAANAYVGPRLNDYVGRMDSRLRDEGFKRTFFMMASNGGVFSVERAKQQPVMLVESGPVGGCIGACAYAQELGVPKMIAFDMGGTTAKCAVIEDGKFEVKSPYYVGGYDYGFPVHGAVLDIVEVGAGGGSIAWIDPHGRLSVGPLSAGSDPGPVAYGRGGTKPTITDANIALGRIDASAFLGGEMQIHTEAAIASICADVAEPLGFKGAAGVDEAASGVIALGAVTMAGAIKQITIERGMDPREFILFAFGGGGPLHAATLARELNIPEVVIPVEPGNFSAVGILVSDARVDETYTFIRSFSDESIAELTKIFEAMEDRLRESLKAEIGSDRISFQRAVEMRYRGQKQGIRAEIGSETGQQAIREIFNRTYLRRYGHVDEEAPIEFVGLHLTGSAGINGPRLAHLRPAERSPRMGAQSSRRVYFPERGARIETPVYQRGTLKIGFEADGPAIIEEYGSTTVVGPDDHVRVGSLSELHITFK